MYVYAGVHAGVCIYAGPPFFMQLTAIKMTPANVYFFISQMHVPEAAFHLCLDLCSVHGGVRERERRAGAEEKQHMKPLRIRIFGLEDFLIPKPESNTSKPFKTLTSFSKFDQVISK